MRYVAGLPTIDGGKFALTLYILYVDFADFYIPSIAATKHLIISLETVIEARTHISKLYIATCTYVFMMCQRDIGYELGIQYDALVHLRGTSAVFDTQRIVLAQEVQTTFKHAVLEGRGNPFLTQCERLRFLTMADVVIRRHAEALGQSLSDHHDAIFSAMCRFANHGPEMFPIVPSVGTEML